ncbi:MAG TPA: YncE family protein [Sphingomicrobium sp.]|nr:YncE family protein [Sphingomicrobium sp.]
MSRIAKKVIGAALVAAFQIAVVPYVSAASSVTSPATNRTRFVIQKIALPGEGRGDFLTADRAGNRLYVTHGTRVHILDLKSLKELAEVTDLTDAHGVAVDPVSGRAFVTDSGPNAVVMFDPASGRKQKSIAAGKKPDSILFDPASGRVLAFNGEGSDVTVINPAIGEVVGRVKLPSNPESAQTDGKGRIWVTMGEAGSIAEISAKNMKFVRSIPLSGCDDPAPLAFDGANRVLFTGCGNRVMIVADADTGKTLSKVPIGGDPDGIVFDPARKRLFVANRDGGWTIVAQRARNRYSVTETLKIDPYAKTVALDPGMHRVFSSTADLIWPKQEPGKKYLPTAKSGTFRVVVVSERH